MRGWPAIPHGPDRDLTGCVLISGPRRTADVQIGVRRAIEHHPRARISHGVGQAATFGIVRPNDHPVRTNRNSWTCFIEGIGIAVLRRATKLDHHAALLQIGNEILVGVARRDVAIRVVRGVMQSHMPGIRMEDGDNLRGRAPARDVVFDELEVKNRSR